MESDIDVPLKKGVEDIEYLDMLQCNLDRLSKLEVMLSFTRRA
ncbi:hypothetical protein Ct9H90mP29_07070 [bacterium]|nr:MAG: hypothetical protein Ct9H90mP29_07070 [bacterium]